MSTSVTLYCAKTKQAVHVAERSSSWFRGPDYPVVVGAFCLAHAGMGLESTQDFGGMDNAMEYQVWTPGNVRDAYAALAGAPLDRPAERLVHPYL